MSTYASLLTTPFLFIVAEKTSQHFRVFMIDDESNNFSLFPQNTARIVNKKVNNNNKKHCCFHV